MKLFAWLILLPFLALASVGERDLLFDHVVGLDSLARKNAVNLDRLERLLKDQFRDIEVASVFPWERQEPWNLSRWLFGDRKKKQEKDKLHYVNVEILYSSPEGMLEEAVRFEKCTFGLVRSSRIFYLFCENGDYKLDVFMKDSDLGVRILEQIQIR